MFTKLKIIQVAAAVVFAIGILFLTNGNALVAFVLWLISAALYGWIYFLDKDNKRALKQELISRFQQDQLCIAIQNPNLVYRILKKDSEKMKIQIIWSQMQPVHKGKILTVKPESVFPFNERDFLKNV